MIDAMRRDYESGMTLREVGERYYCDHTTVRKYLLSAGCKTRPKGSRKNYAMLQHDWNAGLSTERIAKVYGYKNIHSVHGLVAYLRKRGWDMKRRHGSEL